MRYRIDANSEWQWASDNFGVSDGEVILQPPIDLNFLGAGPVEMRDGWHARKLPSEAPGARLYTIESSSPIPINPEGESKQVCATLGHIVSPCRWFALTRIWEPWLGPRQGREFLRLDKPAVLLSFLRSDGQHVVLLPINGVDDCLTTFSSDESGNIIVCAKNDTGKERKFRVLAAMAWSFEVANASVMYEMRKQVVQSTAYQDIAQSLNELNLNLKDESVDSDTVLVSNNGGDPSKGESDDDSPPTPQWMAAWYDSLAYCTWNSLGQDLNVEKIAAGLQSLADNNINIATLIIDDNWQSLTGTQGETSQFQRAWTDFEANPVGFPNGLKAAVDRIREAHPRIRDIAVWHALLGYWGCVSPDTGHLKDDYKLREITIQNDMFGHVKKHVIDPSDIHRMYDDFYGFLRRSGVTSVKTDAQFFIDLVSDTKDRRDIIYSYQSAWTQAYLKHLTGKAISCMSQIPQILCHSFLPTNTPRIMLRNSDDFFPEVEKSHRWHVFTNAHAAVYVQHLNVLPDWDMFQTSHPWSGFHAAARCVSGGPIYITDTPGQHDVNVIHQMTAKNPRGETVILRPTNVGKTLGVYDTYDEGAILKVGTYNGRSEVGTGIMGLFNMWDGERSALIPITKIPGIEAVELDDGLESNAQITGRKKWIVRSHVNRTISGPIAPTIPPRGDTLLECTLPVRGYDIWTALPIHGPFSLQSSQPEVAVIGLLGKMTGACAIVEGSFTMVENEQRLKVHVQLKALGTLGVWVSDGANRKVEDLLVVMKAQVVPQERVKITTEGIKASGSEQEQEKAEAESQRGLIEIDVEGAWNDLKLDAGWNNEVGVEIYIA